MYHPSHDSLHYKASEKITPVLTSSQMSQSFLPPAFSDHERLSKIQGLIHDIDNIYKEFAEKNHVPGIAYGVMLEGKLVHKGSIGYIDIDKKIPASTQSMFRIASMTKSFTAMAILKLRDEGKLTFDDRVSQYIPEMDGLQLTGDSPIISIRDLLTHSAGLPTDDPWADRKLDETNDELMEILKKGIFFSNAPGIIYEYSNLAYAMLGYIIEKASGVPYQKYISENIWQPLDMKAASWEFSEVPDSQLAHGYKWIEENWKEEEMLHDGIFGAMGGMIASVESFSRYVAFHQSAWPPRNDEEAGPIKRSSIREMHQLHRFNELVADFKYPDGRECPLVKGYGYGLNWLKDGQGRVYVGHSGGLPGFGSNWFFMPDYGVGVIFFANITYALASQVNLNVLDIVIKGARLKPRELQPSYILKDRQGALLKLLPDWKNAETSGIFAENFFLDSSMEVLKKQTKELFEKAGKIICIREIIPANQLSGYFIIECEKHDLKIQLDLTPENPPLIQKFLIKDIVKETDSSVVD